MNLGNRESCYTNVMFLATIDTNLRLKDLISLTNRQFIYKEYHEPVIQYYV